MTSHLMNAYERADLEIVRGEGTYVWDSAGRSYLDFIGGMAVLALGHCHPILVSALEQQARILWHASNIMRIPAQERLAETLTRASFADFVFFNNSGSEAVDFALKLVRRYFNSVNQGQRWRVITLSGGYHGRTLATIAAGGSAKLTAGFEPVVEGFDQAPFDDLNGVAARVQRDTAAILLEPIQGDGGVRVASKAFLVGLRELADKHGLLLVLDEVQTGIGRTGRLFAHEWYGITPDVVAAAKGLGAGFPLAAVLATERVGSVISPGSHGGTVAGSPLAMAVGRAVLHYILAEGFLEKVVGIGHRLQTGLERVILKTPGVFLETRGLGLMVGLKCACDARLVMRELRQQGLLVAPASDNVIRLLPPLVVTEEEVDQALDIITRVALTRAP